MSELDHPTCHTCGKPYRWDNTGIGAYMPTCTCVLHGWIGVDFDKTLAEYTKWVAADDLGKPILPMVNRVKRWLRTGYTVKIFTARVWHDGSPARLLDAIKAEAAIRAWCERHLGQQLEVTNVKDIHMIELWDDRCVQMFPNTGDPMGVSPAGLDHGPPPAEDTEHPCVLCRVLIVGLREGRVCLKCQFEKRLRDKKWFQKEERFNPNTCLVCGEGSGHGGLPCPSLTVIC